jgi:hypothetical protein
MKNGENSFVVTTSGVKEPMRMIRRRTPPTSSCGEILPTDTRQDDRLIVNGGDVEVVLERDEDCAEEQPVYLSPRVSSNSSYYERIRSTDDIIYKSEEDDILFQHPLLEVASPIIDVSSPSSSKDFLRRNQCPVLPTNNDSPVYLKRDNKQAICRSLAWSQDSQEERRLPKRKKHHGGESSSLQDANRAWPFVQQQCAHHHPLGTPSPPTMVHWEEKLTDPMDLNHVIQSAIKASTPKRLYQHAHHHPHPEEEHNSTPSPTMVHWEEKLTDPMDLTHMIQSAIKISTTPDSFQGTQSISYHHPTFLRRHT